jgi:membrane protein required for colicin V production
MDILIILVLAVGAIIGFTQGAFKQIANSIGILLGLGIASLFYKDFGKILTKMSGADAEYAQVIAFVVIVIIVPVLIGILANYLTKFFSLIWLGWLNHAVGIIAGIVSYGLLLSVVFNVMDLINSSGGVHRDKLEKRTELFYKVKHTTHFIMPDILIVSDLTEVANGYKEYTGMEGQIPLDFPMN